MQEHINNRIILTTLVTVIFLTFSTITSATSVFYTDSTNFQNALGSSIVTTEDFTGASGSGTNTINTNSGLTVTSTTSLFLSSPSYCTLCIGGFGTSYTFNFPNPVNFFGVDIFDLGDNGANGLTLQTANGSQILFSDFIGADGNQLFAGVIDTMNTFLSATFISDNGSDAVNFDNAQFGSVPEPASFVLMGLGLAGLGLFRRKRAS